MGKWQIKLDRWIGRHMSAARWMAFWFLFECACVAMIIVLAPSWWCVAFIPGLFLSVIMYKGNARRRNV